MTLYSREFHNRSVHGESGLMLRPDSILLKSTDTLNLLEQSSILDALFKYAFVKVGSNEVDQIGLVSYPILNIFRDLNKKKVAWGKINDEETIMGYQGSKHFRIFLLASKKNGIAFMNEYANYAENNGQSEIAFVLSASDYKENELDILIKNGRWMAKRFESLENGNKVEKVAEKITKVVLTKNAFKPKYKELPAGWYVRNFTTNDADKINYLRRGVRHDSFHIEWLEQPDGYHMGVFTEKDIPITMAGIAGQTEVYGSKYWVTNSVNIATDPDYQNQGWATHIRSVVDDQVFATTPDKKIPLIIADVLSESALKIQQKLGAKKVGNDIDSHISECLWVVFIKK